MPKKGTGEKEKTKLSSDEMKKKEKRRSCRFKNSSKEKT